MDKKLYTEADCIQKFILFAFSTNESCPINFLLKNSYTRTWEVSENFIYFQNELDFRDQL